MVVLGEGGVERREGPSVRVPGAFLRWGLDRWEGGGWEMWDKSGTFGEYWVRAGV